jgi:hypothetical protein
MLRSYFLTGPNDLATERGSKPWPWASPLISTLGTESGYRQRNVGRRTDRLLTIPNWHLGKFVYVHVVADQPQRVDL